MNAIFALFRFESPFALVFLGLFVLAVGFLVWTYLGIWQRSARRLTWWLLGLRVAGLLFLVLALVKPTWTREREVSDPGRVLVIVDNSLSMMLPTDDGSPRYQKAKDAVDKLTAALARKSDPRVQVELFDIEGKSLPDGMPEKPEAERTDLERALRQSIGRMRSHDIPAVVLISDGVDTTRRSTFNWLDAVRTRPPRIDDDSARRKTDEERPHDRVPVHCLGFPATSSGDFDLEVKQPSAPERALVHNALTIDVPIAKTGAAGSKATVSIKRGRDVVASQQVTLGAGSVEQTVSLTFTPRQPGRFVYTAGIEGEAGEKNVGNNHAHFPLRVDAEPIRVLYIEGHLRTEAKFLKTHLEDDPDVALKLVIRRFAPETPDPATQGLFTDEHLKEFDVVILGDMEGSLLREDDCRRLVRWLEGKNHSLLVLGGYSSLGPEGFPRTLTDALPVVLSTDGPRQSEAPFRLQLTEKGRQHPIFNLTGDRVKDAESWQKSQPLEGLAIVKGLKPAAEELAVHPSLQVEGKPAIVLAVQRAPGGGQVMVLTADTTWRWSRFARIVGQPDTLYSRFWSQSIRWLAGRSQDDDRPPITVSTDRPDYRRNDRVIVRVERQKGLPPEKAKGTITVEVARSGVAGSKVLTPKSSTAQPDVFTAEFYPTTGGRYEVTATLKDGDTPKASQVGEFLVQGIDLELASPGPSPATLQSLATATGGAYLDVDRAEDLADRIDRRDRRTTDIKRSEYWNSPVLFLAFLGAISAEWFIRRRNHLV